MSSKLNIVTVIGARPQFIKAAVLSRLIAYKYCDRVSEYLIHTGQHYDPNMSEVFFSEMDIPHPGINLEVGSGSHGKMTGKMLALTEGILVERDPDLVLVYGDTNSTLSAALAASKLNVPVAHVEAGLRSYDKSMPEEQNRIVVDHLSSLLFAPTATAVENLSREGIVSGVSNVGDVMKDVADYYGRIVSERPRAKRICTRLRIDRPFFLLTLHRAENTDQHDRLSAIASSMAEVAPLVGIFPIHPRTRAALDASGISLPSNIRAIDPIGYLDMVELERDAAFVVTDSGGVQKEAYMHRRPCITLRNTTEWVETVAAGANVLAGADPSLIREALRNPPTPEVWPPLYGDGQAGERIMELLLKTD